MPLFPSNSRLLSIFKVKERYRHNRSFPQCLWLKIPPHYLLISQFIYIILATGTKTPWSAESSHSGPVQDSEHCHNNHYVLAPVVSNK